MYRYLRDGETEASIQTIRQQLGVQLRAMSQTVNDLRFVLRGFEEFDDDYWTTAADWARGWVAYWIENATAQYVVALADPNMANPQNAPRVLNEINLLWEAMHDIQPPPKRPDLP